jgi:hypothetical protein
MLSLFIEIFCQKERNNSLWWLEHYQCKRIRWIIAECVLLVLHILDLKI